MAMSSQEQDRGVAGSWSVEDDAEIWRSFSAPGSDEQFCQAWLALLCRQLPGVAAGVILFQASTENVFLPVAVWPDVARDLSFLGKVAERALVEGRGVVHRPEDKSDRHIHVAYPVEVSGRMAGAVVLEAAGRPEAEIHSLLRQLHWGVAWLHDLFNRRELANSRGKGERIGSVLEVLATALRRERLQQTLFDIANHVGRQLQCSRVSFGLVSDGSLRVAALSNAAWFEKNSSIMQLYKAAMEDAFDAQEPVTYQRPREDEPAPAAQQDSAHARLAQESGAQSILSVPLQLGAACVGVLTLERNTGGAFDADDNAWVDALASMLTPVIDLKRKAERGYVPRMRDDLRTLLERLFGPRYLIWKFSASFLLASVLALTLIEIDYRVTAKTVIEGEVQLSAVAPFEGFIAASYVRAGDTVKKGQVLCRLDDRDLKLEQQKWNSEREQYLRKLREAVANHEMPGVQILTAQVQQAEAQHALVTDRLNHVEITAPFDGIVISGDLSQLIGSPVELGKELFEIAPLQSYRVVLQVDEGELRHVELGQRGHLLISGIAGDPVPLSVSKITPMATARDGRNFFRVEARLDNAHPNLRPGMEGVGKVSVGDRRLGWVMTHTFTDWLRLTLWNWLP
jgi:RND family efflux transporter MFP subunit